MKRLMLLLMLVVSSSAVHAQGPRPAAANGQNQKAVPPMKMFDDLYYIGTDYVCAYVLRTSGGLILVDTLYGEFTNHTVEAIRSIGMDPKDIKYILITHGHQDHFGGAKTVRDVSGARVVMTEVDWTLMERSARGDSVPRDIVAKDGDTIRLGNTAVKFYITPGHTPGVLSMEFPVHEGGREYKAFLFGGANVTSNRPEDFKLFIDSVKRLKTSLTGIDVNLASHPWQAGILERGEKLPGRKPGDPNPFVAPADFKAFLDERLSDAETRLAGAK
jgi:metallo-beta-lactamase class B